MSLYNKRPYILLALLTVLALLCSWKTLLCAAAAAIVHELGHYVTLRIFGVKPSRFSMTLSGFEMRFGGRLSYGQELCALLMGPASNVLFFLIFGFAGRLWGFFYVLGGAQLLLGAFNLLPICGLDGYSILWIITALLLHPDAADRLTEKISIGFSALLLLFSGWLVCRFHSGMLLLWTAIVLFLSGFRRLGLVKPLRKR